MTKKPQKISDEDLMKRFQEADLSAYDEIVNRYKNQLFNFAFRFLGNHYEAQDVVQETFVRLFTKKHAYQRIAKFSTWIYTITGNLAKTELRKRKRKNLTPISQMGHDDQLYEIEDIYANPEKDVDSILTETLLQGAINQLPPRFKQVVILVDIQEMSYDEVAEIMHVPLGTIKSRLNRARKKLAKSLKYLKKTERD
jgi:RNA polymerase sigma-70 factor, ECF subfamily